MRARRLLALAAGAAAASAGGGMVTTGAQPAPPPCTVTVAAVSPTVAHPGDTVTVSGSGFTCGGTSSAPPAVTVGGHSLALVGTATDSSLALQAADAWGGVQVTAHDRGCHTCPPPSPSEDDRLLIAAPTAEAGTLTAPEGGRLSVPGSDLALGGHLAGVDATACGQDLPAVDSTDTVVTLTAPGQFCQGPLTLRMSVYTDTERDATTRLSLPAGRLDTAMVAGGLSVTHAAPGEDVRISGSGFGGGGAARLGGRPVPSTWFDRVVEITPEPDSVSGEVELVRADGRRVDAGRLGVDQPAARPAAPAPGPVSQAPRIPPTPPPSAAPAPPPSPHPRLVLRPAQATGLPGRDVPFTVTLTGDGGPVAGAAVDLAVVRAPGGDAVVTPSLGLTDADGRVAGLLHLSRRPGDHVIAARAARSSVQITVAACCSAPVPPAAGRLDPVDPDSDAQRGPVVAAACACLVLFLSGFALNLLTGPHGRHI